jgi:hypothetical protein
MQMASLNVMNDKLRVVRWAEFVERMGKTRDKHELLVQET